MPSRRKGGVLAKRGRQCSCEIRARVMEFNNQVLDYRLIIWEYEAALSQLAQLDATLREMEFTEEVADMLLVNAELIASVETTIRQCWESLLQTDRLRINCRASQRLGRDRIAA